MHATSTAWKSGRCESFRSSPTITRGKSATKLGSRFGLHPPQTAKTMFSHLACASLRYRSTMAADLIEVINIAKSNRGYRYLLTVVDVLSKYAWVEPVRSKTGKTWRQPSRRFWNEVEVENLKVGFWGHNQLFQFPWLQENWTIGLSAVGKMYIICALWTNARTCLYSTSTMQQHFLAQDLLHYRSTFLSEFIIKLSTQDLGLN